MYFLKIKVFLNNWFFKTANPYNTNFIEFYTFARKLKYLDSNFQTRYTDLFFYMIFVDIIVQVIIMVI